MSNIGIVNFSHLSSGLRNCKPLPWMRETRDKSLGSVRTDKPHTVSNSSSILHCNSNFSASKIPLSHCRFPCSNHKHVLKTPNMLPFSIVYGS
ncbi:hypothetical protein QL285_015523 [Trifolium repens]|nr:hypothetical protein QL285_015523 [Trifolium repens]